MNPRDLITGSSHWSVTYSQWAVGAGFFHSQEFATRKNGNWHPFFRVVYDCGSSRKRTTVEREVGTFVERHGLSQDLLFISHFDKDHVSGLPILRGSQVRFGRALAPLLEPEERLLAYAKSLSGATSEDSENAPEDDEFYRRLIAAPAATLGELAEDVDLIPPGDGADEGDPDPVPPGLDLADDALKLREDIQRTACTIQLTASAGQSTTSVPLWEFKYFVFQRVRRQAPHFREQLRVALGLTKLELANCLEHEESLLALVTDYQDQLRAAYDALSGLGSRNDTSLCLYSGPPATLRSFSTYRSRGLHEHTERPEIGAWQLLPGWLGTGDAPLKAAAEIAEFNQIFKARKALCGYLALPHHGSRHNHNDAIFDGFAQAPTCLVGADGRYGHPHQEVVLSAANRGSTLIIATTEVPARSVESCTIHFR